ncbi:MAG: DUF3267 domain-containing protein [Erysipelotrichaceae bacterium]|nr:DUF3267 domain-containing protein [Erysipelotrichaceae bacterium]
MPCLTELPDGYRELKQLNLQDDKKTLLIVNGLAVALYLILFAIAFIIKPFDLDLITIDLIVSLLTCVAFIVYMVLHELTHGIAMKHFGGQRVKYGFTGLYAYAGSDADYFSAKAYIKIALAPFVLWTLFFTVLLILCHKTLYWSLIFLQVTNISGCAGDIYVAYLVSKYKEEIYVRDTGLDVTIYGEGYEE